MFNGLGTNLGNLSRLSKAKTRSISPENFTGEKNAGALAAQGTGANAARELGVGWKISPSIQVAPGETATLADIEGPGALQSIWMTGFDTKDMILRIYWDGQDYPSVEAPAVDFFAYSFRTNKSGSTGGFPFLNSLAVMVAPNRGFSCYWEMPFRRHCRVTLENIHDQVRTCYYQINYVLTDIPDDAAYFHASYRQARPLTYKDDYTIIDGIQGQGHYVGTYLGVGLNGNYGWWGEGEIKFFMDGDVNPTICGTGTEDYFCGAYNWDVNGRYETYSGAYCGMYYAALPDGLYQSQPRFGMYRWHIVDPIRFEENLRVTIQDIGWASGGRYLPRRDDFMSVAYWYQTLPGAPFEPLPTWEHLELN